MTITIAIPALFLLFSWAWAAYHREVNAQLLALWAIASFFIISTIIK